VGGFIPGMPATGKAYEVGAKYVVRVSEDGKIAIVDAMGAMAQLGLLPPPPSG
jgi:hypothetical protein